MKVLGYRLILYSVILIEDMEASTPLDYWSLFDLFGLFLSSLGPAPHGATKQLFYLPVTAVCGWCREIGSTSQRPYMLQCTWHTTRFSLAPKKREYKPEREQIGLPPWLGIRHLRS
jgi:hypothetical protein